MAAAARVELLQALSALTPTSRHTDTVCAKAVSEFQGDINSVWVNGGQVQLLSFVVSIAASRTLAALAARGDVDTEASDEHGCTPLFYACKFGTLSSFLHAFPAANVHAESMGGKTALDFVGTATAVQALLDHGAVTPDPLPLPAWRSWEWFMPDGWFVNDNSRGSGAPQWLQHSHLYKVVRDHVALRHLRTAWAKACMAVSKGAAVVVRKYATSRVLSCTLSDGLRACIPVDDYLLASEYVGLIALFL